MITIRIFDSHDEAKEAQEILTKGGFESEISEDKFEGVPIQEYNIPGRYRLKVNEKDFNKVTEYLASFLKKSRLE